MINNKSIAMRYVAWEWLLVALVGIVMWAASVMSPVFSYNRWDNFEYFTPLLTEAHSQWLRGSLPFWNFHQHLGEPLLAQGQPGVFYFPYTICYALTRILGLTPDYLTLIITLMHLAWGGVGCFRLLKMWGVRPLLALTASLSACFGSYLVLIGTIWGQMVPVFSWLPWILIGSVGTMEKPGFSTSAMLLIISLTASALIGYPQTLVYTWLWVGLFVLLYATVVKKSWRSLRSVVLPAGVSVLFSAPTLFSMISVFATSLRSTPFDEGAFLERSVHPQSLLGFFSPVMQLSQAFLDRRNALAVFQGMWVMPVVLGIILFLWKKRGTTGSDGDLVKIFKIFIWMALGFFIFALGRYGLVYPLTRHIPIWSSFRWPFKFLLFGNASLAIAAGAGLELWARALEQGAGKVVYAWAGFSAILAVALMFFFAVAKIVIPDIFVLVGGLGALACLPWLASRRASRLFAIFTLLSMIGVVGEAQDAGLKTYPEKFGSFGAAEMGIDPADRYLPISGPKNSGPAMQSLGLFHSATMNGMFSATGCATATIPWWQLRWLPSNVTGLLSASGYIDLIGSPLLRSWNVGYVIARDDDAPIVAFLQRRGYLLHKKIGSTDVFEDSRPALPRVYFASDVYAYSPGALKNGLIDGAAPPASAFVEGDVTAGKMPPAKVLDARWNDHGATLGVEAPAGGFLVLSVAFSPDWRVRVDGKMSAVMRTNGTVQGVLLPPGARRVELFYHSLGLDVGAWFALIGCLIVFSWSRKNRHAG